MFLSPTILASSQQTSTLPVPLDSTMPFEMQLALVQIRDKFMDNHKKLVENT